MIQPCDVYDRKNQARSNSPSSSSDSNHSFQTLRQTWSHFTRSNFCSCNNCSRPDGKRLAGVFGMAWVSNKPHCCNREPPMSLNVQYFDTNPTFIKHKMQEALDTFRTQCIVPPSYTEPCKSTPNMRNKCLRNNTFCYHVGSAATPQLCTTQSCNCCRRRNHRRKLRCCEPICCHVRPDESQKSEPLFGMKSICTCICGNHAPFCGCVCLCYQKLVVNKFKLLLVIVTLILLYLALAYYFEIFPFPHKCKPGYSWFTKTKHFRK